MAVLDVQFLKCLAGVALLFTSSLRFILRSTRCEGGVGGTFGLAGRGVTKIGSGRLEPSRGRSYWLGSAQKLIPFNRLLKFVALSIFWPEEGSKQVMKRNRYQVSPHALKLCASVLPSPQPCHYPAHAVSAPARCWRYHVCTGYSVHAVFSTGLPQHAAPPCSRKVHVVFQIWAWKAQMRVLLQAHPPTAPAPSVHHDQGLAFGTPDGVEQWKMSRASVIGARLKRSKKTLKYYITKEGGVLKSSATEFLNRAEPNVNTTLQVYIYAQDLKWQSVVSQLPKLTESEQATQGTSDATSSFVELPYIPSKDMQMPSRTCSCKEKCSSNGPQCMEVINAILI
eukprot:1142988-Pelagomonas_calceolata.AAC.1